MSSPVNQVPAAPYQDISNQFREPQIINVPPLTLN